MISTTKDKHKDGIAVPLALSVPLPLFGLLTNAHAQGCRRAAGFAKMAWLDGVGEAVTSLPPEGYGCVPCLRSCPQEDGMDASVYLPHLTTSLTFNTFNTLNPKFFEWRLWFRTLYFASHMFLGQRKSFRTRSSMGSDRSVRGLAC